MKIRVKKAEYSAVMARPMPKNRNPLKFIAPLRAIVALVARVLMLPVGFRSVKKDLDVTFTTGTLRLFSPDAYDLGNESGICVLFRTENCDILHG